MSMFGFNLWDAMGWLGALGNRWGGMVLFSHAKQRVDVTVNDMLQLCLAPLLALPMFAVGWWQESKCNDPPLDHAAWH